MENITLFLVTMDFEKVFDFLDHDFLLSVVKKLDFLDSFINCIKALLGNI